MILRTDGGTSLPSSSRKRYRGPQPLTYKYPFALEWGDGSPTVSRGFRTDEGNSPDRPIEDVIPDVRDGLTRKERIVLHVLYETQRERGDRNVPTAMLWGRVCEHFYIAPEELTQMLARLGARK